MNDKHANREAYRRDGDDARQAAAQRLRAQVRQGGAIQIWSRNQLANLGCAFSRANREDHGAGASTCLVEWSLFAVEIIGQNQPVPAIDQTFQRLGPRQQGRGELGNVARLENSRDYDGRPDISEVVVEDDEVSSQSAVSGPTRLYTCSSIRKRAGFAGAKE